MLTELFPVGRRRAPWPGQRLCFVLVAIPCLPVLAVARIIVALLTWLCPDDW